MEKSTFKNWCVATGIVALASIGLLFLAGATREFLSFARLSQANHELKWIVIALHQYHDTFGRFPPHIVRDQNGNLHSWRSLVQENLMDPSIRELRADYNFTEPWNSPANRNSSFSARFDRSRYRALAVVGPRSAWRAEGARSLSEFKDGNDKTILLIGLPNTGIAWHEPDDAVVSPAGTLLLKNLPFDSSADFFVVTADGSVHYYKQGLSPDVLAALLTIDAGDTAEP